MSNSDSIERKSGAPDLETPGRVRNLEVSQGDEFQASTSVGNRGGGAEGLRVVVAGDVVEAGLVDIESIGLHGGVEQDRVEREAEEVDTGDAARRFVVDFPEVELAGALADDVDFADMSDERGREVMSAHRASRVAVYVSGRAVEAGDGELRIAIAPADEEERAVRERARLKVFPTARRPRKAEEDPPPHTLRQMVKDETLFALVHLDAPVGAWAEYATDAIGRWNDRIAGADDRYTRVQVGAASGPRPDEDEVPASAFDEEGLDELTRRLPELDQLSAVLSNEAINEGRLEPHKSGGFSYFSCAGALAGGGEPSPALGFWVSVEGYSDAEVDELEADLASLVDGLAESGHVLQGMLDTWAWAPALKLRSVPYEIVCGLNSSGHLRLEWLRQYLRAATPRMWLGSELYERLDTDEVRAQAEVTEIGRVVRLEARSDDEFAAFEETVAPILAGESEWAAEAE